MRSSETRFRGNGELQSRTIYLKDNSTCISLMSYNRIQGSHSPAPNLFKDILRAFYDLAAISRSMIRSKVHDGTWSK